MKDCPMRRRDLMMTAGALTAGALADAQAQRTRIGGEQALREFGPITQCGIVRRLQVHK